jgi:hypothetical protein
MSYLITCHRNYVTVIRNSRLSLAGQQWLKQARKLLQRNMEDGLQDNMLGDHIDVISKKYPDTSVHIVVPRYQLEITNATFQDYAFNTHVPSYLDAGLADLSVDDLLKIAGQPDIEEWTHTRTWKQAVDSGDEVAKQWGREGWADTKQAAARAGNAVGHALKRTGDYVERALGTLTRHLR